MQQRKLTHHYKNYAYILALIFFSFFINFHYSFIGVMPLDNFVLYNGGYKVLNGYIPFNDYWLVTGPLLDYLNALYFKLFNVNWISYVSHSSTFNVLISLSTYFLFLNIGLRKEWSFIYSLLFSVLMYPVVGTPFVDHHSSIFLILGFYLYIHAIINKKFKLLIYVPTIMILSFLSKQTPASYGIIAIIILTFTFYFFEKNNFKVILKNLIIGSIIGVGFIFLFFFLTKINLQSFLTQYILFSQTIGKFRIAENYSNFNIFKLIEEFKFIFLYIFILTYFLIFFIKKKNFREIQIIISIIVLALIHIFHQTITLNQNYIFFLIPFLAGFTHYYAEKNYDKKKYLIITVLVLVCFFSVFKYHLRFNEHRKFNELEKVNLQLASKGEKIHESLKGIKWITYLFPDNPEFEIDQLRNSLQILKNDNKKIMIITPYQFLAPALNIYDNSPNQWHHPSVSFPEKDQAYFDNYKSFFLEKIKKNNIEGIYVIGKEEENTPALIFQENCLEKNKIDEIIFYYSIQKNCKDFE